MAAAAKGEGAAAVKGEGAAAVKAAVDSLVNREQVHTFLTKGIELMNADSTRELLKDPEIGRPAPKIRELQGGIWTEMDVPEETGRKCVQGIEKLYEDENPAELVALRKSFIETSKKIYLQALKDRKPGTLETEKKIPRDTILEFFDACVVMVDVDEDTRASLRAEIAEKGDVPQTALSNVRHECLEMLGWEREHGKSCFGTLHADFPKDVELLQGVERWQTKAKGVCMTLLYEYKKEGGEIKGNSGVRMAVLEIQAREELQGLSPEERGALLQKNVDRVKIFRGLPQEGRVRHLDSLGEEAKMDLIKSEMLALSYIEQQNAQAKMSERMAGLGPQQQVAMTQMMRDLAQAKGLDPVLKAKLEQQLQANAQAGAEAKGKGKAKAKAKGRPSRQQC